MRIHDDTPNVFKKLQVEPNPLRCSLEFQHFSILWNPHNCTTIRQTIWRFQSSFASVEQTKWAGPLFFYPYSILEKSRSTFANR